MSKRRAPGDSVTPRLLSRADPGLRRRATPDGAEVVSGPVASRALKALEARAFTMDDTIFVDEDFDLSNPEDQALYAHERHHQMESGGSGDHGANDAEEMAARAIERMVFHRAEAGEGIESILRDVKSGAIAQRAGGRNIGGGTNSAGTGAPGNKSPEDEAMAGYEALRATGLSHDAIVRMLARHVVNDLEASDSGQSYQGSGSTKIV